MKSKAKTIAYVVIHPDGVISGSWNEGKKMILDASE